MLYKLFATFLISFLRIILVKIKPKGIEPKRYEYKATIIKFTSINLSKLVHRLKKSL